MKSKVLYFFVCICFLVISITNLIDKKYFLSIMYIILASSCLLSIISKKPVKIQLSDSKLNDLNVELRELISKGNKIEAIKKYRIATGNGLVEAKEYIDKLK